MNRGTLINVAKLAVAAGLIAFVVHQAGFENLARTMGSMDRGLWAIGAAVMFVGFSVSLLRWHLLMRSIGVQTTAWRAYRLGFIGVFFNNVVPGLTGGDLVKAYYIARDNPQQRANAVLSVLVDRIIGIVALALIAGVVIPFNYEAYGAIAIGTYGFLAVMFVAGAIGLSRRLKRRVRSLLPGGGGERPVSGFRGKVWAALARIDEAISMYRTRLGTIGTTLVLSFVVHLCIIVGVWIFGGAIAAGALQDPSVVEADVTLAEYRHLDELGFDVYCSVFPIVQIVSSLPIAPAGWGFGDLAFQKCFGLVGLNGVLALSLSLVFRLTQTLISLVGGVFLVLDRQRHPAPEEPPAEGSGP